MKEPLTATEARLKVLARKVSSHQDIPEELKQDFVNVVHSLWVYSCYFEGRRRELAQFCADMECM